MGCRCVTGTGTIVTDGFPLRISLVSVYKSCSFFLPLFFPFSFSFLLPVFLYIIYWLSRYKKSHEALAMVKTKPKIQNKLTNERPSRFNFKRGPYRSLAYMQAQSLTKKSKETLFNQRSDAWPTQATNQSTQSLLSCDDIK